MWQLVDLMNNPNLIPASRKVELLPFLRECFLPSKPFYLMILGLVIQGALFFTLVVIFKMSITVQFASNENTPILEKKVINNLEINQFRYNLKLQEKDKKTVLKLDLWRLQSKFAKNPDVMILTELKKAFSSAEMDLLNLEYTTSVEHSIWELTRGPFITLTLLNFYLYMIFLFIVRYEPWK